jgi:hypothetical protein
VAAGYVASGIQGNFFITLGQTFIGIVDAGFLAEKIEVYSSSSGVAVSITSYALVAMHVAFVAYARAKAPDDYVVRVAIRCAWLSALLHAWFAPFPLLWNRAMLVTFPLEAVAMCRLLLPRLETALHRLQLVACASTASLAALVYGLIGEQSIVYEPYQNVMITWVRGPYGDGRYRYQIVRQENDRIAAEQKQ